MVDLAATKEYLRQDYDAEDNYIKILILLSAEVCRNHLRVDKLPEFESIKQAQLLIIGYFFENREGTRDGIPSAVFSLLSPYRKAAF